jgi:hypothetical protein
MAWPSAVAWKPLVSMADMIASSEQPPLPKSWPAMMGVSGTVSVGTSTAWGWCLGVLWGGVVVPSTQSMRA